jgi:pimeloyl-ACP methyl ester carboxylesterase
MPPLLSLTLVLFVLGLLLAAGTVVAAAFTLLRPPRMTDGKAVYVLKRLSPGDLGLGFEPLEFRVRDERTGRPLRLAAWWIPNPAARGRCAVLIHGYADAKVGAIAWAPTFHGLGWNVLAIDLRAHGESDGVDSTAGFYERHDVNGVLDQLRAQRPEQARRFVLFGVSLGAAVAAAAAVARESDDVAGVILDSPYPSYRDAIAAHARVLGHPGGVLQRLGVRVAEWITGADFDAVGPVNLIPRIAAPLLVVQAGDDPFVPPAAAKQVERACAARPPERATDYWLIPEAEHVQGLAAAPDLYRRRVESFLSRLEGAAVVGAGAPAATGEATFAGSSTAKAEGRDSSGDGERFS